MSCGQPHETDCSQVLAEVWLFLDNECDGTQRRLLAQHLDECKGCLEEYGLEEKLKKLLATKCGGEQAPPALREQIRTAVLREAEVTVSESADGTTFTRVEVRTTHIERS